MIESTDMKNWLTFGSDPVPDTDSGSVFNFPHHCGTWDFRRFISISHYNHRHIFTTLGEMTDADMVIDSIHNILRAADIRIRIRINPEIWIKIPDYF